ncbi:MAG: NADH:ubiquinone oxidoreductase, partial [Pseudomonadota bacterium]
PMLRQLLNETGVYYFWQIAEWSPQAVDYVDEKLQHFKGRISRDDWVGQSSTLAALASSAKRPV